MDITGKNEEIIEIDAIFFYAKKFPSFALVFLVSYYYISTIYSVHI